ncbi:hypothetical protein ACFE04_000037 [Oxalis oulophora]
MKGQGGLDQEGHILDPLPKPGADHIRRGGNFIPLPKSCILIPHMTQSELIDLKARKSSNTHTELEAVLASAFYYYSGKIACLKLGYEITLNKEWNSSVFQFNTGTTTGGLTVRKRPGGIVYDTIQDLKIFYKQSSIATK